MNELMLNRLLPYWWGEVAQSGYRSKGYVLREFDPEERERNGAGFVSVSHLDRSFTIHLDEAAHGHCPIALFLVGLHEAGHIARGDVQHGLNVNKLGITVEEQESQAWKFAVESVKATTRGGYLEYCLTNCVGLKDDPTECSQPSIGHLIEEIGRARGPRATSKRALGPELITAMKKNPEFYRSAAKGVKGADGKAIIPPPRTTRRGSKAVGVTTPKTKGGKLLPKFTEALQRVHIKEFVGGRVTKPVRKGDQNGKGPKVRMIDGVPHALVWINKKTGRPINKRPLKS